MLSLIAMVCTLVLLLSLAPVSGYAKEKGADDGGSGIMVSLGDSFSSGEGIPPFYGQNKSASEKVKDQDWLAHRSENSWPGQLKLPGISGTMSDHRGENWYFVATSGAETEHLYSSFKKEYDRDGYSGYKYISPQLDIFDELGDQEVEYVTMTLGGNDAQFVDVIIDAAVATGAHVINPSYLSDKINDLWKDYYMDGGIRDSLLRAYKEVSKAAGPQAKIIVAGYPKLLDKNGKGALFTKTSATIVNEAVTNFNKEIATLVAYTKGSGIKICYVSVEEEFDGHEAYSADPYLNSVYIGTRTQDLKEWALSSAYSMHPNEKGAEAYAHCVQEKIAQIEADGGKSEWPTMSGSDERDIVLVLDTSGSMDGTPIAETKKAAEKFVDTVLEEDASIGIVSYNNDAFMLSNFNQSKSFLNDTIQNLHAGGRTHIEAGLAEAHKMLNQSKAKKKIIVLMSDGAPNEGKTGEALIEYANELKKEGIYIYTLGFFNEVDNKSSAQDLMEKIASEGYHYEVDKADHLVYFFDDIANQIRGTKMIYIRIACPVDVTVKYDGETLTSRDTYENQRASFGTLSFEENTEEADDSDEDTDNRIKILRLKEGVAYDIRIRGNGKGKMTYTIGFMDEEGEYSDLRKFSNIRVTKRTRIDTVAANSETTFLNVDADGDGEYDSIYRATAEEERGKKVDYSYLNEIGLGMVVTLAALIALIILIKKIRRRSESKKTVPSPGVGRPMPPPMGAPTMSGTRPAMPPRPGVPAAPTVRPMTPPAMRTPPVKPTMTPPPMKTPGAPRIPEQNSMPTFRPAQPVPGGDSGEKKTGNDYFHSANKDLS